MHRGGGGKEEGRGSDFGALPKASGQLHEGKMASLVSGGAKCLVSGENPKIEQLSRPVPKEEG